MPWTETAPMRERMRFVTDWERDLYSMVELCERYGVSRKTGYQWVERYEREGLDGLRELSRPRTIARIGLRPTWPRRSAPRGGSIRLGAPRRSCTG
jgi:transposase-like protein